MKTKLTKKEKELIPKVREEWVDLFFSLEFNEGKAKEAMNFLYELAGLKKPKVVILDSPMEVQKMANECDEGKVRNKIEDKIWDNIEEKMLDDICNVISDIRSNLSDNLWDKVVDEVRDKAWGKIMEKANNYNLKLYALNVDYGIPTCFGWVSYYDYFERIGILKNKNFTKYKDLIKANIFYIIPFEKTCFISRPPLYIKRDEDGELHSEEGYAVEFKDGWGLRYIHGKFEDERRKKEAEWKDYKMEKLKEKLFRLMKRLRKYGKNEILMVSTPYSKFDDKGISFKEGDGVKLNKRNKIVEALIGDYHIKIPNKKGAREEAKRIIDLINMEIDLEVRIGDYYIKIPNKKGAREEAKRIIDLMEIEEEKIVEDKA
jgi:hypothetical protein